MWSHSSRVVGVGWIPKSTNTKFITIPAILLQSLVNVTCCCHKFIVTQDASVINLATHSAIHGSRFTFCFPTVHLLCTYCTLCKPFPCYETGLWAIFWLQGNADSSVGPTCCLTFSALKWWDSAIECTILKTCALWPTRRCADVGQGYKPQCVLNHQPLNQSHSLGEIANLVGCPPRMQMTPKHWAAMPGGPMSLSQAAHKICELSASNSTGVAACVTFFKI